MNSVDGKLEFIINWILQVLHLSVFKLAITGLVHLDICFPVTLVVSENLLFFLFRRLHRESIVFLPF